MRPMAQVENGKVVKDSLPTVGKLKTGESVSGYKFLDEETLLEEGWLPLEDTPPSYDSRTEHLIHNGYEILKDKVVKLYTIERIPEEENRDFSNYALDLDFRLSALELGL